MFVVKSWMILKAEKSSKTPKYMTAPMCTHSCDLDVPRSQHAATQDLRVTYTIVLR